MSYVQHSEHLFFEQTWDLSYRHALGDTVSTFFNGLREGRLLGRRCPVCSRVLFPARSFCDRCHRETDDWVEVSRSGTLEMFTIVVEPFQGAPVPPYVLAYVRPDGADTAAVGFLRGVDLGDVDAAARMLASVERVVVALSPEPAGSALDYWFEVE